jgi:hypothetical protein
MKDLLRLSALREGYEPGDRMCQSPGSFVCAIILLIFSRDIVLAAEPTGKTSSSNILRNKARARASANTILKYPTPGLRMILCSDRSWKLRCGH